MRIINNDNDLPICDIWNIDSFRNYNHGNSGTPTYGLASNVNILQCEVIKENKTKVTLSNEYESIHDIDYIEFYKCGNVRIVYEYEYNIIRDSEFGTIRNSLLQSIVFNAEKYNWLIDNGYINFNKKDDSKRKSE